VGTKIPEACQDIDTQPTTVEGNRDSRSISYHIISYHSIAYRKPRKPLELERCVRLLAMAYCISLHTADCRIGLYHLPVKTIHRSQRLILTSQSHCRSNSWALSAELDAVRVYEQGRLIRSQTLLIPLPYDVTEASHWLLYGTQSNPKRAVTPSPQSRSVLHQGGVSEGRSIGPVNWAISTLSPTSSGVRD
jgi:hypothetical protein